MKDKSGEFPMRLSLISVMKDKSGEFPVILVLHKPDERQIRRIPNEISPS
jgi:hypothetical protein